MQCSQIDQIISWMVGYLPSGVYVVLFHHIIAVLDVTNHFIVSISIQY